MFDTIPRLEMTDEDKETLIEAINKITGIKKMGGLLVFHVGGTHVDDDGVVPTDFGMVLYGGHPVDGDISEEVAQHLGDKLGDVAQTMALGLEILLGGPEHALQMLLDAELEIEEDEG